LLGGLGRMLGISLNLKRTKGIPRTRPYYIGDTSFKIKTLNKKSTTSL
jgi:hypothetical protein